ncbi:hypothetical protein MRX96_044843 [Rhipicephalus microplus]
MTKQAGHSTSTKAATQLITAKPVIQASKASQVGNVKIRSLRHAEPRKPGQPLSRSQHEGRAMQSPSNDKASRSFYIDEDCRSAYHCSASHPSEQGVPCREREKTKPTPRRTSKAKPAASNTEHESPGLQLHSSGKSNRPFKSAKDCCSAHSSHSYSHQACTHHCTVAIRGTRHYEQRYAELQLEQ